jgi:hypothetical protein
MQQAIDKEGDSTPGPNDPINDMNFGQKLLVGAGQGMSEMGNSANQLWAMATNDQKTLAQIKADKLANAHADAVLSGTVPGKIGNFAANAAMAALPIGGMEAVGGRLLAKPLAQGVASGALLGALQPSDTAQGHLENTAIGGGTGAVAPLVPGAVGFLAKKMLPAKYMAMQLMSKFGMSGAEASVAANRAAAKAAGQEIGAKMGAITDPLTVRLTPDAAQKLAALKNTYGSDLNAATNSNLDQAILAGQNNGRVPGKLIADFRSDTVADAADATGSTRNAYNRIGRVLDKQIDDHLNAQPRTAQEIKAGQTKAQQLRILRDAYGQTQRGIPVDTNKVFNVDIKGGTPYSKMTPAQRAALALSVSGEQQVDQSQ